MCIRDSWRGENDNGIDGINTIRNLQYTIDDKSENPNDNMFTVHNPHIFFVNISTFLTHIQFGSEEYYNYDLREPKRKIINPDRIRETKKSVVSTNDWSKIPYYPTTKERRENVAKYLLSMGKKVPDSLIRQIEDDIKKESQMDSYNNFNNNNNNDNIQPPAPPILSQNKPMYPYNQHPQLRGHPQPPPNKFSPHYAAYVGVKSRAQASARVGLGGVY